MILCFRQTQFMFDDVR